MKPKKASRYHYLLLLIADPYPYIDDINGEKKNELKNNNMMGQGYGEVGGGGGFHILFTYSLFLKPNLSNKDSNHTLYWR
jgi:hypothetical protein